MFGRNGSSNLSNFFIEKGRIVLSVALLSIGGAGVSSAVIGVSQANADTPSTPVMSTSYGNFVVYGSSYLKSGFLAADPNGADANSSQIPIDHLGQMVADGIGGFWQVDQTTGNLFHITADANGNYSVTGVVPSPAGYAADLAYDSVTKTLYIRYSAKTSGTSTGPLASIPTTAQNKALYTYPSKSGTAPNCDLYSLNPSTVAAATTTDANGSAIISDSVLSCALT